MQIEENKKLYFSLKIKSNESEEISSSLPEISRNAAYAASAGNGLPAPMRKTVNVENRTEKGKVKKMPRREKCIEGHVTKNARVVTWDEFPGIIGLESYGVGIVLVIESNDNYAIVSTGAYSKTTSKHVTQFLAMLGLRYRSADVNDLYGVGEVLFVSPEKFSPLTSREINILSDIRGYKRGWTYEDLQVFYRLRQFL